MLRAKMEGCVNAWLTRLCWNLALVVLINTCGNAYAVCLVGEGCHVAGPPAPTKQMTVANYGGYGEERDGRCPALSQWGVCPSPLRQCSIDEECRGREKCCMSPCGRACVSPLFTGCEQLRSESLRRARALGGRFHVRVPSCDSNGAFEKIQCEENVLEAEDTPCWCVDASGFELPATRVPSRQQVNCSNPKPCAAHTCRMLCPYGFELSPKDGCPICQCRDPCAGITCPGSLSCQLEEAACLSQPCPPIPTCKRARSLDNICPYGPPLKVEGERPFLCGTTPEKPQCPPLFQCLVQSGHDYGVCCSSSMQMEKQGACPAEEEVEGELHRDEESDLDSQRRSVCEGALCEYDLHCAEGLKCCGRGKECGKRCTVPQNMTICLQQRMLAQLLSSEAEREGRRGYVPQCSLSTGFFLRRQCSRNRLVCWCVDPVSGIKVHGSMGPAENVKCAPTLLKPSLPSNDLGSARSHGRSLCDTRVCAQLCEFGFKAIPRDGCPSCECDDNPCGDFKCGPGEECVTQKVTDGCPHRDPLCGSLRPICRPKKATELSSGTKSSKKDNEDDLEGEKQPEFHEVTNEGSQEPIDDRSSPTMCEYLRDFSSQMEASKDGMSLAVPIPTCNVTDGMYEPMQCEDVRGQKQCWCVDEFGTEIPRTRGNDGSSEDCVQIRITLDCLGLTCRLGCDFGFVLDDGDPLGITEEERLGTRCPKCECRDPCHGASLPGGRCGPDHDCLLAEVECQPGDYCPPVPSCVQKRSGQCPYLVPPGTGTCEYECRTDQHCNGTAKCCSNGCGTQCVQPLFLSACQHQRAVMEQRARESGIPARHVFLPECQEPGGGFAPVQCHPVNRECWCVNVGGLEIPGTKTASGIRPKCPSGPFMPTKQSDALEMVTDTIIPEVDPQSEFISQDASKTGECPMYKCTENCPHGRLPDSRGCPTCTCYDPCEQSVEGKGKIKCGAGEECRAIHVQCVDEPCPPVALCLPRASNPCVSSGGHPLLLVLPAADSNVNASTTVTCGPDGDTCPSTHKCHLSPFGEYAVCCPKTKDSCMGARDPGRKCYQPSSMRWRFNSRTKLCEQFLFEGCGGNLNNFESEEACRLVCPAPTKCERARLRSEQLAQRLSKLTGSHAAAGVAATFVPRCVSGSGAWEVSQCLDGANTPLCWCVDPISGTPIKGTISKRKLEATECEKVIPVPTNLPRRRSGKARDFETEWFSQDEDLVQPLDQMFQESKLEFEEIIISTTAPFLQEKVSSTEDTPLETAQPLTRCQAMQSNGDLSVGEGLSAVKCDGEGRFLPMQCYHPTQSNSGETYQECWCVDEAGNQLSNTTTFKRGTKLCLPTPIEAVEIHLGFHGSHIGMRKKAVIASVREILNKMGAKIKADTIEVESRPSDSDGDTTHVQFSLIGPNKVDVAYQLEQMVKAKQVVVDVDMDKKSSKDKDGDNSERKDEAIRKMVAEITSSYFSHRPVTSAGQRVIALEHREIFLSEGSGEDHAQESPLFGSRSLNGGGSSSGAALLGVCAVSSFIICILSVLLMVQRGRAKSSKWCNGMDSTKKGVVIGDMEDGGSYYKTCDVVPSPPSSQAPIYVLTTDHLDEEGKDGDSDRTMLKNQTK